MINIQCNLLIIFIQIHYNHPIINISHEEQEQEQLPCIFSKTSSSAHLQIILHRAEKESIR